MKIFEDNVLKSCGGIHPPPPPLGSPIFCNYFAKYLFLSTNLVSLKSQYDKLVYDC